MQKFRVWWNSFKTVALLLSFFINMLFVIVLLLLLMQIFQVKTGLVEPAVDELYRIVVDLDEAVITSTVDIRDEIPVSFDLPINQTLDLELTADVPVAANATFTLPGGGGVFNGRVDIVLPRGSVLPLRINTTVPVNTNIPVEMAVDVSIPLAETELHEPLQDLRARLRNYVRALDESPDSWGEVPGYARDALRGDEPD